MNAVKVPRDPIGEAGFSWRRRANRTGAGWNAADVYSNTARVGVTRRCRPAEHAPTGGSYFPECVSNGGMRVAAGEKLMVQAMNDNHPLDGVRVLVVEDDALMAMDLETRWSRLER